jgi:hypothetical protein
VLISPHFRDAVPYARAAGDGLKRPSIHPGYAVNRRATVFTELLVYIGLCPLAHMKRRNVNDVCQKKKADFVSNQAYKNVSAIHFGFYS